uniref:Uncharacterized protein n=1 Tax=Cucumis melo TaxID=3656 RepID=A0A9I9E9Y6_CUCME
MGIGVIKLFRIEDDWLQSDCYFNGSICRYEGLLKSGEHRNRGGPVKKMTLSPQPWRMARGRKTTKSKTMKNQTSLL